MWSLEERTSAPLARPAPVSIERHHGVIKAIFRAWRSPAILADTASDRRLADVDGQAKSENYCRTVISGSALSGTRRHCALSSASKSQVSPPAEVSSIWPCSSRHCLGEKAAIAGSHFGLRNT